MTPEALEKIKQRLMAYRADAGAPRETGSAVVNMYRRADERARKVFPPHSDIREARE